MTPDIVTEVITMDPSYKALLHMVKWSNLMKK